MIPAAASPTGLCFAVSYEFLIRRNASVIGENGVYWNFMAQRVLINANEVWHHLQIACAAGPTSHQLFLRL